MAKPPNIVLKQLRGSSIPQGYLLGRASAGTGAVELISPAQAKASGLVPPFPASLPPSGPAGGDLTGTYPNPGVGKLIGRVLNTTAPTSGQVMTWDGTEITWETPSGGGLIGAGPPSTLEPSGTLYSQSDTDAVWSSQPATEIVQHFSAVENSSTPGSVTVGSTPTVGNLIIAFIYWGNGNTAQPTVSSNWTQFLTVGGNGSSVAGFGLYHYVQAGDTAALPAFCTAGTAFWAVALYELDRVSGTFATDVVASNGKWQATVSSLASTALTTTGVNQLGLLSGAQYNGSHNPTFSSGWTSDESQNNNSNFGSVSESHQYFETGGSSVSGTVTFGGSGNSAIMQVVVAAQPFWELVAPGLTSSLASGDIFVGNGSNIATAVTMSGDVTLSNTGAATIKTSVALAGNPTTTTQSQNDNSTKIATTAYTDLAVANGIAGVNPAVAVDAATTAAADTSSYVYNNGVSGIGATLTGPTNNVAVTIDGFTFTALGQRLLVKNDTQSPSGAFNGVYYVTQLQGTLLKPILTRALDYDQPSDMNETGAIPVINGTVNALSSWLLTSKVVTIGTTPLTYARFSYPPTFANPTATAGPAAVNGSASTFMRSDAAPAVQKASASQFGIVEVDGTTITASAGVITAAAKAKATMQVLTTGTAATYTPASGATWIKVRMVGGGGGSAGSMLSGSSVGDGVAGNDTIFNGVHAAGGSPSLNGPPAPGGAAGGTGGTGTAAFRAAGGAGGNGNQGTTGLADGEGGVGGNSLLGSGGTGGVSGAAGVAAQVNSGGGGGGSSYSATSGAKPSGGAGGGEYVELILAATTYTYTIGSGGAGGTGQGASGQNGAAGGSGVIIVEEYYT